MLPYVQNYNTVLLGNHGIVCWADTVTHAEWYAEVLETYCWTLMLATQLGAPVNRIPAAKTTDLLNIKKRLGLPDPRFHPDACTLAEDLEQPIDGIALPPPAPCRCRSGSEPARTLATSRPSCARSPRPSWRHSRSRGRRR